MKKVQIHILQMRRMAKDLKSEELEESEFIQAADEIERLTALLDAEMESNKRLCERELLLCSERSALIEAIKSAYNRCRALNSVSGRQK